MRNDRSNGRRGGGTAIAVHNRQQYQLLRANATNKVMVYTAIKIKVNSKDSLLIFSIYATQNTTTTFINELVKLASDYNLDQDNVFYVIAGDFSARSTECGDSVTNDRGRQITQWLNSHGLQYKAEWYPPNGPIFPRAGSLLDYGLIDHRIDILDKDNERLATAPYDSDHNAIVFSIDTGTLLQGLPRQEPKTDAYNFRKANWNKFKRLLTSSHPTDTPIPTNRNLTLEEIDKHILELETRIRNAIQKTVPKGNNKPNEYYKKYDNNTITKLHKYKSFLITRLYHTTDRRPFRLSRQEIHRIKRTIKRINKLLQKEFKKDGDSLLGSSNERH